MENKNKPLLVCDVKFNFEGQNVSEHNFLRKKYFIGKSMNT